MVLSVPRPIQALVLGAMKAGMRNVEETCRIYMIGPLLDLVLPISNHIQGQVRTWQQTVGREVLLVV